MRWHRDRGALWAQDGPSYFRIAKSGGYYYLTERDGVFGQTVGLGKFESLAEAKQIAENLHPSREENSMRKRCTNPGRRSVHTAEWDRCVKEVRRKGTAVDPYAVCTAALGELGAIKKSHRRRESNPPPRGKIPPQLRPYLFKKGHRPKRRRR